MTEIHGWTAAGFESVADGFRRAFEVGERGAGLSIYSDGREVVRLWGGMADSEKGAPWQEGTMCLTYSATKGATALLVHRLAEQGRLDLDEPIARQWPEFGRQGKGAITTRDVLTHRAGLPYPEVALGRERVLAGDPVMDVLAEQAPIWEPRTRHGYHALTFGWILGGLVRAVTGQTLGRVFADEIAAPLGLDFHIGLRPDQHHRVATLVQAPVVGDPIAEIDDPVLRAQWVELIGAATDPGSVFSRAFSTNGDLPLYDLGIWNGPQLRSAELPAANGIGTASALARLYAASIGDVDGVRVISDDTFRAAAVEQVRGPDATTMLTSRYASGFQLPIGAYQWLGASSVGHAGAGGALGFADPESGIAFGYVTALVDGGPYPDARTAAVIAAVRASLG